MRKNIYYTTFYSNKVSNPVINEIITVIISVTEITLYFYNAFIKTKLCLMF